MNRARLLFILLTALALTACDDAAPRNAAPASATTHTVGEQGAQATLRVSATQITTADRVTVRLTTTAPATIEPPAFDGWTISDTEQDHLAQSWTWTLEPFLDGEYTIPPISITFADSDGAQPVSTPDVAVQVSSVLEEGDEQIAGVKGVVDAPEPDRLWLIALIAGAAAALVGGCIGLALMLAAKARQKYELRAPAHELALARLDAVLAVESGGVEGAVVRMSDVVRAYIEDRYAVRAPEQTTEEFLAESRSSMRFNEEDVALLGRFLTNVDLIKFAGASANPNQASEAAETLRQFIRSTASSEQTVVISEAEAKALPALQTQRVRTGYEFAEQGGGA